MEKPTANDHPIHDVLRARWSPRAFAARPVTDDELFSLFEAARWAPSGGNSQPWSFIVARANDASAHARMVSVLNPPNAVWAAAAPLLILAIARRERSPGVDNLWASYDLGQAMAHLSVQASALGLVVHQMGGFNRQSAREQFQVPEGYDPLVVAAVGAAGDPAALPEELRNREMQPRTRKALTEFVFEGMWEQSIAPLTETA
jgi:nitroreductase